MRSENFIQMTTLDHYGWSNFHDEQYINYLKKELSAGRVITVKGFKYLLITEKGELETELSGKLLYGNAPEYLPKVGDWVLFLDYDTIGYLIEVLPRLNALIRKVPGTKTGKQVLASNIDYALIVQGIDRDFNLMRLERYIVQITTCGIKPVVVLNKSDIAVNPEIFVKEVLRLNRGCPVYLCSTYTGSGIDELQSTVLEKNKTYILVGSSGVGKSSLLNALMNQQVQRTGVVSDFNHKGKHTTASRDLFMLANGSLIIDTPGMREFGLTSMEGNSSTDMFPAIGKFSERCRFRDCKHINETGCAVISAVNSGDLDETIYESYLKLTKEQRRFEIKAEDKKRIGKQMGKMIREAKDYRNKYKGG